MVNLLPAEPVGDAVPMAEPMSQQEIAAHNIASGLQTGQISNPSALTQVQVADTALINIMPSTWRQPTRHEAKTGTLACALLTAICYFALNHHEVRKNVEFLPATCEPYSDAQLRPEIRPYRHCSQQCLGCFSSWTPVPCSKKMGMHYSINEYDMQASMYIAGSCAGQSCCAKEVCQRCTKHTTRCSNRRLGILGEGETTSIVHNTSTLGSILGDDDDDDGPDADRNVVVLEEEAAVGGRQQMSWLVSSIRRRLSSCRDVTTTYDCNCRCVQRVFAKACSIRCEAWWRSFVPIRISLAAPAVGFLPDAQDTSAAAALAGYRSVMSNATMAAAARAEQEAKLNRTDTVKLVELAEVYTPGGVEAQQPPPFVRQGYGRVVTAVYEHRSSRGRAIDHLEEAHFIPGIVSECFYDPRMRPGASVVKAGDGGELYFGHEMGFTLWKWMLLLLLALATATWGALIINPGLLGGEVVISSATVVHSNIHVVKDRGMY
jgi:hypothetical protein